MQYGLIGRKLGHSFSALFFNEKFRKESLNDNYSLFELPSIIDFPNLLDTIPDLCGLNVTIPYKEQIIPFLDRLTPEAKSIGAINTIKIERTKDPVFNLIKTVKIGHNTDATGFEESLKPLLNPDKAYKGALILGTGGASKAVQYVLKKIGISFKVVSRKPRSGEISYSDLSSNVIKDCELIINCTPLGMFPDVTSCPPIPYGYLTPDHICFDLVYNPDVTEFMRRCRDLGAQVINGLTMLHRQALAAWDFWQEPIIRRYLANDIRVESKSGAVSHYRLCIADVTYSHVGEILNVNIQPFTEEKPDVEYFDEPLIFKLSQ